VASITREPNGRRLIRFLGADGKRKTIRLGKVSQRVAEEIRLKVEQLNVGIISRCPVDNETARWVNELGDDLAAKLAAVGLIRARRTLGLKEFIDSYIDQRTDVKPNTVRNLKAAQARLIEFFGANKHLRDITPGDADSWLLWLKERYADATTGRTLKRAKQFFRVAVRRKLVPENAFGEVKAPGQVNESRKVFISLGDARKVLDACPDAEWRLIFSLSRFGGLRCPSEHLALELTDVDWERDRIRIRSSKTGDRSIPIFSELRPHLLEVFEAAQPGTVHVINRYRATNANLRTQFMRIIRRAGLTPWTKPFHNLRATRETELAEHFPLHVVCAWIGNTERIAAKHYLQVPDDYFQRAAKSDAKALQIPVQHPVASSCTELQALAEAQSGCGLALVEASECETVQSGRIPPRGLEPRSSG
jgi:integrase